MDVNRRNFLKVMGMGSATAALVGCGAEPPESVIPYVIPPRDIIPGEATWYATVCRECPAGCGIVAKAVDGRVLKVEGNPDHPVNRGRLCARGQASLQGLYDPDRIRQPLKKGANGQLQPFPWEEAERLLVERLSSLRHQGDRLVFVTPLLTGSLDRLIESLLQNFEGARRFRYEALSHEALREANRLAFGMDAIPSCNMEEADLVLSFGADFLETWVSPVEYAGQFAAMRAYREGRVGRFAYVGPRRSLTAANADEWISVEPGAEGVVALSMVGVILAEGLARSIPLELEEGLRQLVNPFNPSVVAEAAGISADKIRVLARAFARERNSLALADGKGPSGTSTCLAVNILNYVAGNLGRAVRFGPTSAQSRVSSYLEMQHLLRDIEQERVAVVLLAGVNPLFTLPEGNELKRTLKKVPLVVSFASFLDETADASHVILPDSTFLESWGDFVPWDGIYGLQQPLMRPLYDTRSLGDVLLSVAKQLGLQESFPWEDFHAYLRNRWKELHQQAAPEEDFESFWSQALQRGGLFSRETSTREVRLNPDLFQIRFELPSRVPKKPTAFTLMTYPSPFFYDGRMANRPWLQELPDALTQIVWDSWLEIHPGDARQLGVKEGDVVQVKSPSGRAELAVHLSRGVRRGVVSIPVGQGHTVFGRYAQGRGANPIPLLPAEPEAASGGLVWLAQDVAVTPTGRTHALVSVAGSTKPHERGIVQIISLNELQSNSHGAERHHARQMYPEHPHPKHRWGMSIDVNSCIGCSACVTACYAENNIPVMGKEQVGIGREMSWIRIERVDDTEPGESPHFLPMLCQHCDNAPCEPVCPVYATYHNPEGLNAQVYNRCVGTRYCANNCPYTARRFNWFATDWPEPLQLQLNPDVSVRSMGVMEKCTFCVQRIRAKELTARAEGRPLRDGEIVPACAQTCPTQAIVFGDLKDPASAVSRQKRDSRQYHVLDHLNTQPAITYLKKIKSGPVGG